MSLDLPDCGWCSSKNRKLKYYECCYATLRCCSSKLILYFFVSGLSKRPNQTPHKNLKTSMINLTKPLHQKAELPEGYEPSPLDVLCGRGVECFNHSGNVAFRRVLEANLDRYTSARTKLEKSILVVEIVDMVRNSGGSVDSAKFLRMNHKTRRYYEIGDDAASKYGPQQAIRGACGAVSDRVLLFSSLLLITV